MTRPIPEINVNPRKRSLDMPRVQELARSIATIGLLNPITVTEDGTLIAGWHRLEACRSLGWEEIEVRVATLDDLARELAEIDENLIRNELTVLERAEQLHRRKQIHEELHPHTRHGYGPGRGHREKSSQVANSFADDAAGLIGVHPNTVRRVVQIATDIPESVRDLLRATPTAENQSDLLAIARMEPARQLRVAHLLSEGRVRHPYEAERELLIQDAADRASALPPHTENCTLLECDVRSWRQRVEPGSVDLILTDPPYGEEHLPLYEDLALLGKHALRRGGSLLAMTGQMHLPRVLEAMTRHLRYHWVLAYLVPSHGSPIVPTIKRRVNSWWKPVLWLTNGEYQGAVHGDLIRSGAQEKALHDWQQDLPGMEFLVERFSLPGELVMDPCVGSGTTGIAALRLGRRFLGGDDDPDAVALARNRIARDMAEPAAREDEGAP